MCVVMSGSSSILLSNEAKGDWFRLNQDKWNFQQCYTCQLGVKPAWLVHWQNLIWNIISLQSNSKRDACLRGVMRWGLNKGKKKKLYNIQHKWIKNVIRTRKQGLVLLHISMLWCYCVLLLLGEAFCSVYLLRSVACQCLL